MCTKSTFVHLGMRHKYLTIDYHRTLHIGVSCSFLFWFVKVLQWQSGFFCSFVSFPPPFFPSWSFVCLWVWQQCDTSFSSAHLPLAILPWSFHYSGVWLFRAVWWLYQCRLLLCLVLSIEISLVLLLVSLSDSCAEPPAPFCSASCSTCSPEFLHAA